MSQEFLLITVLIIAVPIALIALNYRSRYQLKQSIKQKWGTQPYQKRLDQPESLKKAWLEEKKYHHYTAEVDDLTWYDLDMESIFALLNNTYSSVGSEALYKRLRNYDFNDQNHYESLIKFFAENAATREKVQYLFATLGKQDNNFSKQYLAEGGKNKLPNTFLYVILSCIPILALLALPLQPSLFLIVILFSFFLNVILYFTQKFRLETELTTMRYLVQTLVLAKKMSKVETPLQADLKAKVKPFKGIEKFAFSFRVKGNSEAEIIFELVNMIFLLPLISYNYVLRKISRYNKEAISLWDNLGDLEVALAILNFRTYMPLTCLPTVKTGGVEAEAIYHPLIQNAVANPVDWQKNTLVTGSNASGKSTYVKSIAINCILAQTINTATAETFKLQAGHVLSSMAVEDDLFEGDSYFVAEIKSIKRLLDKVATKERCYCFIDEILKGTNTIERIAASSSVVEWLGQQPSLAFVATHDIELTEILKNSCDNLHFEEQVTAENGISFDYRLRQGAAKSRNAIALLGILGYPSDLVANAKKEAAYFDQEKSWQVLG